MSANEDVLRWIAQEVDAGREVSAARVAAAWEIDELGAERALGEDWLAFRAMECGHERRDMHGSGEYCAACRHDERHKADFPAGMTDDQVADQGERIWAQFGRGDDVETVTCEHRWRIDEPNGMTSRGVCRLCGATRQFSNVFLNDQEPVLRWNGKGAKAS